MRIAPLSAAQASAIDDTTRQARLAVYRFEADTAVDRRGAVRALSAWLDYSQTLPPASRVHLAAQIAHTRGLIDYASLVQRSPWRVNFLA